MGGIRTTVHHSMSNCQGNGSSMTGARMRGASGSTRTAGLPSSATGSGPLGRSSFSAPTSAARGVLRLEYYLDGNLHFQEILVEIHFEAHADHETDHDHDADHGHGHEHGESASEDHHHGEEEGEHHHEMLLVKSLPAAEQALAVDGDYEHQH